MVYLEREDLQALRREAQAHGLSLAEMLRRVVREHLRGGKRTPAPRKAYLRIVALGSSGLSDISERHDEHLAAALRREHSR
jgi:uncharacterized protein Yka (UPF0111/DUF47 family)